jgi:hypothetical protein
MKSGRVRWAAACVSLGWGTVACGGSDKNSEPSPKMGGATADCGTVQEPLTLTLKDVTPAAGTTVTNQGIVESFTIVGKLLAITPTFAEEPTHTVGHARLSPTPWSYEPSGADMVYTSTPITWENAGHVELGPPGLLVQSDGCVSILPTPTFSYDVTAP